MNLDTWLKHKRAGYRHVELTITPYDVTGKHRSGVEPHPISMYAPAYRALYHVVNEGTDFAEFKLDRVIVDNRQYHEIPDWLLYNAEQSMLDKPHSGEFIDPETGFFVSWYGGRGA